MPRVADLAPREAKARRLLGHGAVYVWCDEGGLLAIVDGDHGRYRLNLTPRGPSCDCPARIRDRSHAIAVQLLTGARP